MSTSFLFGGQVSLTAETIDEFAQACPAVGIAYEQAADATGIPLDILRARLPESEYLGTSNDSGEDSHSIGALRQAAFALGFAEELAGRGLRPAAAGGLSLGALIATCVAGAVARDELFRLLHRRRLVPLPEDVAAQGMALMYTPVSDAPKNYYGKRRPGVYLAVDTGPIDAAMRSFVLSGYMTALREILAEVESDPGPRQMYILDAYQGAFHSPLQQYAVDFMREFVDDMTFRDPRIPVCSPVRQRALRSAEEVKHFVLTHNLLPARYEPLIAEMDRLGMTGGLVLGPGLPAPAVQPFPVEVLAEPADLDRLPAIARPAGPTAEVA